MASLNKVMLIGNLTRDPEVAYIPSGTPVAKLGLAVSRKYTTANKETKEEVCYVNVVVWGKQAEACGQYLVKGRPIFVEGRLQYEEWEKDGQKRNALKVVAERVQFLGSPKSGESRDGTGESAGTVRKERPAEKVKSTAPAGEEPSPEDTQPAGASGDADDLPF
jgi:single-strand DNA-binding protein